MHVEVKNLNKSFGSHAAVDNVSFSISKGKLVGLLGPSGGGKTTVLRMLAGLETPDSGDIYIHGQRVNELSPQKRGIGIVFQNYALFKHMTVFDNIAFGLTVQKKKKAEIVDRVFSLLELTGLKGLEKRFPNQLSGGQRQRVAFARALAPNPQLLLLDEPFAAIDAKVRKELRTWLKQMIAEIGITSIFVTHDQDEAVEVADEIMIINRGGLEQKGTPIDIYKSPETPFVAEFIGESTVVNDITVLKGFEHSSHARAIVRPEFIEIGHSNEVSLPQSSDRGTVRNVFFRGAYWLIEVQLKDQIVRAVRPLERDALQPGEEVLVFIHRLYAFKDNTTVMLENSLKYDALPVTI